MLSKIYLVRKFTRKMNTDHVSAFSAQATLFVIMSFFPFIMFIFAILQYLPISQSEILSIIVELFPSTFHSFLISIVSNIYTDSTITVLSIAGITAIWSASRSALSIIKGLNSVYGIHETRNYFHLRIIASFYTLLFAIVLTATLIILVFGNRIYKIFVEQYPFLNNFVLLITSIRLLVGLVVLIVFFLILFKAVPNHHTTICHELPGSIISALGWVGFAYIFSIYVDHFSNFSYMYGSLTTAVLIMLWIYICMNILFFGAEINIFMKRVPAADIKKILLRFRRRIS